MLLSSDYYKLPCYKLRSCFEVLAQDVTVPLMTGWPPDGTVHYWTGLGPERTALANRSYVKNSHCLFGETDVESCELVKGEESGMPHCSRMHSPLPPTLPIDPYRASSVIARNKNACTQIVMVFLSLGSSQL